jgi:hypothetical protein
MPPAPPSQKTLVSVLIAAYNAELWLAETLDSAVGQTWPNTEVVVVDDGSTDGTLAVARRYESVNVKVVHQENAGACAARNRAFAESRGDLIQYLDADDLLAPDKIARQVDRLRHEPEGTVAAGPYARFFERIENAEFVPDGGWRDFTPALRWVIEGWPRPFMLASLCYLTPREVAERAGPWDEALQLNQDGEYFTRVLACATKLAFCEEAVGYYRSGIEGSISRRKSPAALESLYRTCQLREDVVLAQDDSPEAQRACAATWQGFAYTAYPSVPHLVRAAERRAAELGGTSWVPESGRMYNVVRDVLGWKVAHRLQSVYTIMRYY